MDKNNFTAVIQIGDKKLKLGGLPNGSEPFKIIDFSGFSLPDVNLKMTENGIGSGSTYNGTQIKAREFSITCRYEERQQQKLEMEQYINNLFTPLKPARLTINKYGYSRFLDFYIKSVDIDHVYQRQALKFLLNGTAPYPFWKDTEEFSYNIAETIPQLHCPFIIPESGLISSIKRFNMNLAVNNKGSVPSGINLTIKAKGAVLNPKFENLDTGQYLRVLTTMELGDELQISTHRGNTYIRLNGVNISQKKDRGSRFFQIEPGQNTIKYNADDGYAFMEVYPRWRAEYLGV